MSERARPVFASSRRWRVVGLACGVVGAWLVMAFGLSWIAAPFERMFREVGVSVCPVTWTGAR